jgi:CubicO group peptidase (beta-lactamase class C family)
MKFLLLLPFLIAHLAAQTIPAADPAQLGLAKDRLARIAPYMNRQIEANHMSGAVGLVLRNGKVAYFDQWGYMDRESKKPMRKDAIFRMYSMTKAATGVAVMMLMEEGRFFLTDPVSKYLPEFAKPRVAVINNGRVVSTEPAEREITIRDLLRHTSGVVDYTGPLDPDGTSYLQKANLYQADIDLAEVVHRIAKIPLIHQPGTTFHYGYSIDVLGRLVEVVSGKPFDQFLEERLFKPLGMVDTGFYVPESKWNRFVAVDVPSPDGTVKRAPDASQQAYKQKPAAAMGGQGMVSTAMDYGRFCQMLLNGGTLDGKRILGRKSVELMSTDHLGNLARAAGIATLPPGIGFGLTFAVTQEPGRIGQLASPGEYFWSGAAGTRFWIDPKEKLITIFMVNIFPHYSSTDLGSQFKLLVYQSIAD